MKTMNREQRLPLADAKLSMMYLWISFAALLLGAVAGILQTLVRTGVITLPQGDRILSVINGTRRAARFNLYNFFYHRFSVCITESHDRRAFTERTPVGLDRLLAYGHRNGVNHIDDHSG